MSAPGVIEAALAIATVCSAAYCVLTVPAALLYLAASGKRRPASGTVPISVITPVAGAEPALEKNLRSSFEQDYADFEVLIVAHTPSDPAVAIAEKVIAENPGVPARVVISGAPPCPNAKVFNLEAAVKAARHDLLVMKDSDVRAGRGMLKTLAAEFAEPGVGLATCPYRAVAGRGFWWRMDAVGTNTRFFGGVLVARMLQGRMDFALGPTLAIRKQVLDCIGGLEQFREYLAEDFMLGNRAHAAGCGVILSSYVVDHHFGGGDMRRNLRHRLRWSRSTRRSRGLAYLGELFTHPLPLAAAVVIWNANWWPLGAAVAGLRAATAWLTASAVLKAPMGGREWLLLPLEDFVGFGLWFAGLFGNSITWRGRRYLLSGDGRFMRA